MTSEESKAELPDELEDDVRDYDLVEDEDLGRDSLSDIVLYTLDWSVSSILERIGTTIDINPMFQRRDAWTVEKKSLYIESLLVGLPVPQVVLAEDVERKGRFIVLDGKQRLTTLKQFAAPDDLFPGFKLRKLEFATEAEGMNFSDMSSSLTVGDLAESFLTQPIRTIVVRNWRDPAVLYQVFVRLNQGSVSLSPQELRQALFPSPFTAWVNERSAGSTAIQRARRITKADFRMRDAEMLLRFVAFTQAVEQYRGNLRLFLDQACVRNGRDWANRGRTYFDALADRCDRAIERTFAVFSGDAFRRFEQGSYNNRFNIAVFDLMTLVLGDDALSDADVIALAPEIKGAFEEMCLEDREFAESLLTTTKTIGATGLRLDRFGSAVQNIAGKPLGITPRAATLLAN